MRFLGYGGQGEEGGNVTTMVQDGPRLYSVFFTLCGLPPSDTG